MTRSTLVALVVLGAAAAPALGADMHFTCPTDGQLLYRDAGAKELTITVGDDALTLDGPFGAATLPATIEEREGMIGVRAVGAATAPMPDRAAIDACIAKLKASQPSAFEDGGRNAYLELGCKSEAAMSEPVPVAINVELAVIEKPEALLTLTRRHADEEGDAADLHGVEMIGSCTLAE